MGVALACLSHTPLLELGDQPRAEVRRSLDDAISELREFVLAYDPTLVVLFAPDHYNGFFHDLMPPFCVGFDAVAVGDFDSQAGPLDVPAGTAAKLAQEVIHRDIDMAISRRMEVDHGAVQPLEVLFGDIAAKPVIPIFVNSVAEPFTTMRRIRLMGAAVGSFVTDLTTERVLLVGSGGLSHDPPVPRWDTATDEQREAMLDGRHPTTAARAARQQRVIDTARAFAAGTATIRELNPAWDNAFLDLLHRRALSGADAMTPDQMAGDAGNSAHEVRTWLAAFSALSTASPAYTVHQRFYRAIPEYIAGFAVMAAR
ncbi:3-carboxyethylcatechol 2,3-dioxygenase [Amycolatopsis pithecellobii]|uniref:3-carboxyethylcatechol 2,3-dioxygenase n=1 Tax=Amycolatopsis pithecellobii TaxID=664692 RepID=A0A6N7Z3N1_9PSEU|nr:3-carboxyethylcatechol 2,3-dioxygenase [Amycolatopsis pithecellobii]MTD56573.1 3-carboxyethylcatechol 2,3-dioxygenase [Amycolatopsis pithecellobii]